MAFPAAASISGNPIVQTMITNGMTPATFGIYLNRNPGSNGGQVTFGGFDSTKIASGASISYLSVTSAFYWSVVFNSIRIGSTTLTTGSRAIMDSGVSLIFGPSFAVNIINNIIGATYYGNGLFTVNCNNVGSMPIVVVRLGGVNFNMPSTMYTVNISGICFSGFSPLNVYNNEGLLSWVLGDVFLSTFYSIYDIPNQRVGLARSI